jgi:hypothetical protein
MLKEFNIAIIGMGQRGLCVLERIAAILESDPVAARLNIHVIDPSVPGQGLHEWDQPQHLLINTIAGQVTVYCDKSVVGAGPIVEGPTFLEWAWQQGYRKIGDRFVISQTGVEIDEDTYLPRSVLGEYMTWAYDKLIAEFPSHVRVFNHRKNAIDILRRPDGRHDLKLEGDFTLTCDFIFLTTGHDGCGEDDFDIRWRKCVEKHNHQNSHLNYSRSPYPIEVLNSISPEARVAICGTGLTAADILSALTIGLGGRFEPSGPQSYRYNPCGREPKITLFSRQGLPASGRAVNQKGVFGQYKARFFTMAFVDQCRQKNGSRILDWDRDLMPMLRKEMAYVYSCIEKGEWVEPAHYNMSERDAEAVEEMLAPLKGKSFKDAKAYRDYIIAFLKHDIDACFQGNETNPVKAAADMLRDIRDNIRYAVDYAGLFPQSHERFLSTWCSISNRIASGPPKERNMELLALIEAGIVELFGPKPDISFDEANAQFVLTSSHFDEPVSERFDVLLRAKVELLKLKTSTMPLIKNMYNRGMIREFSNGNFKPSGVDIDVNNNIITQSDEVIKTIWGLGYIVEGAHFYTYVLPRPYANSRGLQDAGKSVLSMFAQIKEKLNSNVISMEKVA